MAATAFPPTNLTLPRVAAAISIGGAPAVLYTDASRQQIADPSQVADNAGILSPAASPFYADNGVYTVTWQPSISGTGPLSTTTVTVTGGSIPGAALASPAMIPGPAGPGALVSSATATSVTVAAGQFIAATGGAGGITVTLPAQVAGTQLVIKKVDAGVGTVTVSSAALIDGAATRVLSAQYASLRVFSDGATWQTF